MAAPSPYSDPFSGDSSLSEVSDDDERYNNGNGKQPMHADDAVEDEGSQSESSGSALSQAEDDDDDFEEVETVKEKAAKRKKNAAAEKKLAAAAKKAAASARTVPFDSVVIPMGDKTAIEKLVSWRIEDGREEILVKYKNMSYCHAEWLSREAVEASKMGKMRVKRFLEKPTWDNQFTEEEPFNPSFKLIDRLLDEGELGEGEIYYLVKWRAQTYDASTWEHYKLVEELDSEQIPAFNRRRALTPTKEKSYTNPPKRPVPGMWSKMDESPLYKNDMQLRPYQLEGLNWLLFCWYNRQNSILADEMGLGKTVQSTVFLDYLFTREGFCGPFLIVTPLSTIGNWEREIKTWTDMNVVVYHGRDVSRNLIVETEFYYRDAQGRAVSGVYKFDIILTTYEMAMSGAAQLRPIPWRCVVLDEAHRLKNKASKVSEILKTYNMAHRVLLTGTPLQNSLDELWALLNFLQPDRFASESAFQAEYGSLSTAADVEKLQGLLKPLMLRRMKEDVEKSIPVKEETIVEVELTTVQKKWYRSILEKNFAWLKQGPKKTNVPNLINTMIELRKCCIHPFLLKGAEDQIMKEKPADTVEAHFQALIQASGKMVLIDKLLMKLRAGGHKVLIFSQMTRCLDIIQDYLRGRQWQFERIDGGVRGDLRQAAIDRFSAPGSDTFVFLLCTRAGGVGINLTAADTCIIFDSDWNPQNDLQAQSRVHRIGQKRPVQIYRLITRNTYEREMFDRASMKLGLDRALLQRMDGESGGLEGFDGGKPPSSMSKTEIEELLKKGAYGAMLDDDASNSFCDEDIDSILTRRTQVIKHDAVQPSEKGSIFSKATFSAANADNVDINDPDFWDKMAQRAKLEVSEPAAEAELILDLPRQRRQVQRFGDASRGSPGGTVDGDDNGPSFRPYQLGPGEVVKPWAQAEKTRLERAMMVHGFSGWDEMAKTVLNRRQAADIRACARAMVIHGLQTVPNLEAEILSDVKAAIDEPGPPPYKIPELPYHNPTRRQHAEYRSFLLDAPPEYYEHLEKRAKNMLARISMMYTIRERIKPTKETEMPKVAGAPPVGWWGPTQDLHLLIGIAKHGYQQYDKIRMDPELCFFSQTFADLPGAGAGAGGAAARGAGDDNASDALDNDGAELKAEKGDESDGDFADEPKEFIAETPASEPASGAATPALDVAETASTSSGLHFPSPSDLGFRLRRIMSAFQKLLNAEARESAKKQLAVERSRAKQEKEQQRIRLKELDFSRKEKQDFHKTLMSYGVETVPGQPGVRDWRQFKDLSNLRKSVETLEDHYLKLMASCEEVIRVTEEAEAGLIDPPPQDDKEKDPDAITYDRAKKLIKRLEQMRVLREDVLPQPQLDDKLAALRRHGRSGLPSWWTSEYDRHFLNGIAKWGLNRSDLIMEDPSSVFFKLHKEFLKSLEVRQAEGLARDELVDGRWEDKFWMREPVALRRFEVLCEAALKELPKRAARGAGGRKPKAVSPPPLPSAAVEQDDSEGGAATPRTAPGSSSSKSVRLKLKFGQTPETPTGGGGGEDSPSLSGKRKRTESKRYEERDRRKTKSRSRYDDGAVAAPTMAMEGVEHAAAGSGGGVGGSSGDDTDAMLQAAQRKTDRRRKRRREEDYELGYGDDAGYNSWDNSPPPTSHARSSRSAGNSPERKRKKHRKSCDRGERSERHSRHRSSRHYDPASSDQDDHAYEGRESSKRHRTSSSSKHEQRSSKDRSSTSKSKSSRHRSRDYEDVAPVEHVEHAAGNHHLHHALMTEEVQGPPPPPLPLPLPRELHEPVPASVAHPVQDHLDKRDPIFSDESDF
ncbi:SNF2 family N-terminal domain-containing protein [Geranomyces variabilis]|nr:SNF2 family N-terminal domain-containing protein [Geranomyces variabilis]KAJ3138356.1 choline dehydrogenase 7 [Geranomyces variabilis]